MVLSGKASTLPPLMGTRVVGSGKSAHAVSALRLPDGLEDSVSAVVGLDNRPVWNPAARAAAVSVGKTGSEVNAAYGLGSGYRGARVTVGTVQYSGWDSGDLTTYAQAAGIALASGQVTSISVSGASTTAFDGTGGQSDVSLDQEALLAVAPSAKQRVYATSNSVSGTLAMEDLMASDATFFSATGDLGSSDCGAGTAPAVDSPPPTRRSSGSAEPP